MSPALTTPHYLIVDDDPEDIFLTKRALRNVNPAIIITGITGSGAFYEYWENQGLGNVDVILLDINMPKVTGIAVLESLSQAGFVETVKVIMFSTSRQDKDVTHCKNLGAVAFFLKPSDLQSMHQFASQVLKIATL